MNAHEQSILDYAAVTQEAAAVSDAALSGDLEEARFRTQLLAAKAHVAGFPGVALAAADLMVTLGPPGGLPGVGFGADILKVADELDAISPTVAK